MELREKQVAFQILTPCTLNCRLCADYSPLYRERGEHYFTTLENYCHEIEETFRIYDFIEDVTITGGEPLLHQELPQILTVTLRNYTSQFKTCRIFSNGTIVPSNELLNVIRTYADANFEFVIDHYGLISNKADEIRELLEQHGINYRINHYYGSEQHCGGWVDYGPLDKIRNYPEGKPQEMIERCHNATWKNLLVFKGKLFLCTQAAFGYDMNFFGLGAGEYIDLFDDSVPIEKKKNVAFSLGKKAINACRFCNGFDVEHSRRYPAGEQI